MDLVERAKQILISPKTEWPIIDSEDEPSMAVLTKYVLLLAAIPAFATLIGNGIIGYSILGIRVASVTAGISSAINHYITIVGGVYVTAYVISFLAETFGSYKSFEKAFSLVAYAYTPVFIAGIFLIWHPLRSLSTIAMIYSLYLLYIGLSPMMKTPDEKRTPYFVVSLVVMVAAHFVLALVMGVILGVLF